MFRLKFKRRPDAPKNFKETVKSYLTDWAFWVLLAYVIFDFIFDFHFLITSAVYALLITDTIIRLFTEPEEK